MSLKDTDVRTPGIASIARKWKLPVAEVARLVAQGAKHEKEHNTNQSKAEEVARDHINERPDYYKMLSKAEKTKVKIKEETGISGVRGLGYVTGDPAVDPVQSYIDTNSMAYQDENGNKLDLIKKKHLEYHNSKLGFNFFDPTDGNASNKTLKEAKHPLQVNFDKYRKGKLNELGGNVGYEGLTDAAPKGRRNVDLEEGPKLDKAKKIAKTVAVTGMTAANMYTMGDAISQHKSHPQTDMVRAATTLPGAAGWGASAVHYGKKGYDLAKATLKKKKQMEEDAVNEDLRKWFREKWVRYDTKGNIKGPCAREEGEGKPKCRPLASARAMSKDERAKSARRKRREDPVADRPGKGGKPIMVNTNEETLLEKNVPTNPALWARAKAQAKAKFDVYPSAYANGWASKWYKSKGGGWKSAANESVDEACWDNYKQKGMKKKGNKMVPNCVPVEEQGSSATPYTERPTYESAAWQRKAGKNPEGGLNRKGIASYRRENPGSKLSMAVTTEPSKLDPDSKPAKRRKSFCARMGGMPGPMKDEKGRPTRKALSLRKWNCEEENKYPQTAERGIYEASADLANQMSDEKRKQKKEYEVPNRSTLAKNTFNKNTRELHKAHKHGKAHEVIGNLSDSHLKMLHKSGTGYQNPEHKSLRSTVNYHAHQEMKGRGLLVKKINVKETTQIDEKAPPGAKYERMVKHIKAGYAKDGLTKKEKGIAFATAWKAKNKELKEDALDADSINAISREARFRDPQSLKGVLHVIHNRMTSGKYASSAKGVLSQKGQFAAYGKGAAKGMNDADRQNIQKTWDDVSSGRDKDITGGANEFRTTSSKNRPGGQVIGGNTYYKTGSFAKAKTPEPTQVASAPKVDVPKAPETPKTPEAPKPTQVASAPETPKMQNPDQNITKIASAPAPTQVSQLDTKDKKPIAELHTPTPERLGRYISRSAKQRKQALKGPKDDVKTWERKHHFIQSAFKKLTKENMKDSDWLYGNGQLKEELQMENQNLINEALENILENNLNDMKENLLAAINEKAMEKLEERKKAIAADYFAQ
jgi:hypothetical protein